MWIRSQDLYTLVKCIHLSVRQRGQKSYCVIGDEHIILGEYSKNDKALNILNEIVHHLEYPYVEVFQMPQDDEVEI